jgi:hypothetical protein
MTKGVSGRAWRSSAATVSASTRRSAREWLFVAVGVTGSLWIVPRSVTGMVRTVSRNGVAAPRIGAMTSSHRAGVPEEVTRTQHDHRPRRGPTAGRSGNDTIATDRLTSSGASRQAATTAGTTTPASPPAKNSPPP